MCLTCTLRSYLPAHKQLPRHATGSTVETERSNMSHATISSSYYTDFASYNNVSKYTEYSTQNDMQFRTCDICVLTFSPQIKLLK